MGKYLWMATYTADGAKGLLNEGGTGRRSAIEKLVGGVGGKIESFYYAFGEDDVFLIVDLPDDTTAAGVSLAVAATGAVRIKTITLLTPEQIDEAAKRKVEYRPPGA